VKPHRLTLVIVGLVAVVVSAAAQEPKPSSEAQPQAQEGAKAAGGRRPLVPLEVQVSISRYQGEKRISSMPYVLAVNANSADAQLTMNVDVPVATTAFAGSGDKGPAPLRSFNYRPVGTNIVCGATTAEDGRFEITIGIDESSVVPSSDAGGTGPDMPAFRNFKSRNRLLLRDGQMRQYTAATDRVTGETVRVDVTLRVVK
jgi:hypothetical protein